MISNAFRQLAMAKLLARGCRLGSACVLITVATALGRAAGVGDDAHVITRADGPGGFAAIFSADGTRILTADREAARVWDARSLKPITPPLAHGARIENVTWTAGDRKVVTIGANDVRFWDASTGAPVAQITQPLGVWPAAVSADGKWVLTAADKGRAVLWGTDGARQLRLFADPTPLYWTAFSRDVSELLTFNFDPAIHPDAVVHLRDRQSGRDLIPPVATDYDGRSRSPAEISPDGERLVVGTSKGFEVDQIRDFKQISRKATPDEFPLDSGDTQSVHFTPEGHRVIWVCDVGVQVFNAATGEPTSKLMSVLVATGHALEYSPDGRVLLVAGLADYAGVWDVARSTRLESFGEKTSDCVALSPDGKFAAIGRTYPPLGERGYTEFRKLDEPLVRPPPAHR